MALQSSGAISLDDIHVEAGDTSGTLVRINNSNVRALIGKASGAQSSFSEFYGAMRAGLYNSSSVNHIGNYKYNGGASSFTMASSGSGWYNNYISSNFLSPLSGWDRYIVLVHSGVNFSGNYAYLNTASYGSTSMTKLNHYQNSASGTILGCSVHYCVDNSTTSMQSITGTTGTHSGSGYGGGMTSVVMFYAKGTLSTGLVGTNSWGGSTAISRTRTTTAPSVIFGAYATRNSSGSRSWASPMNSLVQNVDMVSNEWMHNAYDVVSTSSSTTTTVAMSGSLYTNSGSRRICIAANMSFS